MTVELPKGNNVTFESLDTQLDYTKTRSLFDQIARSSQTLFKNKIYRRLAADRDVVPEQDAGGEGIDKNGAGLTNTMQRYLTKSFLPTEIVETRLLAALNKILEPDAHFRSIEVQQHANGQWEIFLGEAGKGTIALSHSGSGLKTVLLVVAFLVLVFAIKKKPLSDFIFAFEEIENNLHPALQRRLVQFIREPSLKDKFPTFLTSHSTVLIAMLSRDEAAQIVHVTNNGELGVARPMKTYFENRGVLDDLDVRASDLLQSNGVVWMEGPSDRLYFNRWLALLTNGALQEGSHYQCVFYGGRLLAHLSGRDPWESVSVVEAMKILGINRNALMLMDSDKRARNAQLNTTKRRIIDEFGSFGGMVWVTKGRAIENYLPLAALKKMLPEVDAVPGDYDDFQEFLERLKKGEEKNSLETKSCLPRQSSRS
jgi:putative ATP-dependent endonuclease of the OLD family